MKTKKNYEFLEGVVQILGITSFVVWIFFAIMLVAIASGNVSMYDTSTFSEWARFLFHHPAVLVIGGLFIFWASRIWIRNERLEKEEEWKKNRPMYRNGKLPRIQKPQR